MRRTGEHRFASLSDGQLLEAARDGDRAAFGELWERHRLAGIVAAKNLAPSLDPDDLVSEAYLRVFELVRDGRGPEGAFRPYLYQVIRSAAANRFRASEQAAGELPDVPDLSETAPWDDSAFDLKAAAQAFATLSPRWRAALWYTEVEGMPPREAAPLLGLSPNSASALAARARDALRSAWVDEHVNRDATEEACRSTLQQLQRYQRGKLTAKRSREITAHLAECESCAKAAAESATLNRRLGLVLMWGTLGSAGTGMLAERLGLADQIGLAGAAGAVGAAGAAGAAGTAGAGSSSAAGAAGASTAASVSTGVIGGIGLPAVIATGAGLVTAAIVGVTVVSLSLTGAAPPSTDVGTGGIEQSVDEPQRSGGGHSPDAAKRGSEAAEPEHEEQPTDLTAIRPPAVPDVVPVAPEPTPPGPSVRPPVLPPVTPPETGNRWLRVGFECLNPGDAFIGTATRYGILQLRGSLPGEAPVSLMQPMYDPAFEGQPGNLFVDGKFDDTHGNTFDVGFLTGTDPEPHTGWYAPDPTLLPAWGEHFPGKALGDVALEMRLITPSRGMSTWQPIDTSISCVRPGEAQ